MCSAAAISREVCYSLKRKKKVVKKIKHSTFVPSHTVTATPRLIVAVTKKIKNKKTLPLGNQFEKGTGMVERNIGKYMENLQREDSNRKSRKDE